MTEPKTNETDPFALDESEAGAPPDDSADTDLGEGEDGGDDDDDDDDELTELEEKKAFEAAQREQSEAARAPAAPVQTGMLARIKPYHAKKGQTMRTHSFIHNGERMKFVEGQGWYTVDASLANRLRTIRCSDMDPESNLAFDVCSAAEARKVEAREEQERERATRAPARRPRSATS